MGRRKEKRRILILCLRFIIFILLRDGYSLLCSCPRWWRTNPKPPAHRFYPLIFSFLTFRKKTHSPNEEYSAIVLIKTFVELYHINIRLQQRTRGSRTPSRIATLEEKCTAKSFVYAIQVFRENVKSLSTVFITCIEVYIT